MFLDSRCENACKMLADLCPFVLNHPQNCAQTIHVTKFWSFTLHTCPILCRLRTKLCPNFSRSHDVIFLYRCQYSTFFLICMNFVCFSTRAQTRAWYFRECTGNTTRIINFVVVFKIYLCETWWRLDQVAGI